MHYYKGMTHFEYLRTYYRKVSDEMRKVQEAHGIPDSEQLLWSYIRTVVPKGVEWHPGDERVAPILAKAINAWTWRVVSEGLADRPFDYYDMLAAPKHRGPLSRIAWVANLAGESTAFVPIMLGYHYTALEAAGAPTYLVTPGLADHLRHTEVRGVMCDEVRLPHRALYVDVPPEAELSLPDTLTGDHGLVGVYMSEDHSPEGDKELRRLRVLLVGAPKGDIYGVPNDTTMFFNITLRDEWSLEEAMADADTRIQGSANDPDHVVSAVWRELFAWVLNFILYVTWSEPNEEQWESNEEFRKLWNRIQKLPKGSKKRAELQQRLRKLQSRPRIVVGRGVKPLLTEKVAQEESSRRKISTAFRVAGHWKRQRFGEGRRETKRIFIHPYWKGLEDSVIQAPAKKYVVK